MKKFISFTWFIAVSLMFFNIAFAQDNAGRSKQLLKDKLYQLRTFEAKFTQFVTDSEGTVLQEAKGKIAMMQPNKLYWELFAPNESVLLADGETLWNIDSFMEQVVAYDQGSAIENNPLVLLTNPNSQKWQDFKVSHSGDEFTIEPVSTDASIEMLRLFFNGGKLSSLETRDAQQQSSRLSFYDVEQNTNIQRAIFTFNMPKGYELDDQRNP